MFSLTVPAHQQVMAFVSAFVWAVAMEAELSQRQAYRLRLAVDEVVQNIISYGYNGCAQQCPIQIWAEINPESVSITIEDTGTSFDMTQFPQPADMHLPPEQREIGRLGIFLVTQVIDDLRYDSVNGHNINRLTLRRHNFL